MGFVVVIFFMLILGVIIVLLKDSIEKDHQKNIEKFGEDTANKIQQTAREKAKYGKGYGIKCPNCGAPNVNYISSTSKVASVGTMGLASNKIGKTYKCPKCTYTW